MVICKHLLGLIRKLLDRVGVVIHRLLQDHVTLEHQHGTLLVLRGIKSFTFIQVVGLHSQVVVFSPLLLTLGFSSVIM